MESSSVPMSKVKQRNEFLAVVHLIPIVLLLYLTCKNKSPDGKKNADCVQESGPCLFQNFHLLISIALSLLLCFMSAFLTFILLKVLFLIPSCLSEFQFIRYNLTTLGFFPALQKRCNKLQSCAEACQEAFRCLFDGRSYTITGLLALCVARLEKRTLFFISSSKPLYF